MWSLIYLNMRKEAEPNKTKQKKLISLIDCEIFFFFMSCHCLWVNYFGNKIYVQGSKIRKSCKINENTVKNPKSLFFTFFQSCPVDWIGVLTAYFSLHFSPHVRPWALCLTPLI